MAGNMWKTNCSFMALTKEWKKRLGIYHTLQEHAPNDWKTFPHNTT
jgi:hypothetical protein